MKMSFAGYPEMRPNGGLVLHLSLEELVELANSSADLLHGSASPWPLGARFALRVPDHEPWADLERTQPEPATVKPPHSDMQARLDGGDIAAGVVGD